MSDTFRKSYRQLTEPEVAHIRAIKTKADEMKRLFEDSPSINPDPRAFSLAVTKLEECVMWAVKAVTG